MLLNDTMLLRVSIPMNSRATAYCSFDGKGRVELRQGDSVTIAASQYPFPTVLERGGEWFDSVSRTLRWNTRAAAQKGWDGTTIGSTGVEGEKGEESWDIDTDPAIPGGDSGVGSEEGDGPGDRYSPMRRQMSMLSGF
jgi:NAD+ kinase